MAGRLLLCERLEIARTVWPDRAHMPDHQLSFECLQIEAVLDGGKLYPVDPEREALIVSLATEKIR